ncbi:MAG: acetate--CoA ligase family protein, partial [Pirellulaceae bacterium]
IWTAETDATSAIAEAIASDKQLTRSILAAIGVNVPLGRLVADRDDAWQAAQEIGLPVAVKPANANHARGVSLELNDREAILAAYDWACTDGQTDKIMVEQFIVGDHHRVLVVGDRMVAAARGQREYVVGDGQRTIAGLVAELN